MRARRFNEKIYKINKNGIVVATIEDNVGLELAGATYQQIYRCLKKTRNTYKGYYWCFEEDVESTIEKIIEETNKEKILCLDGFGNIVKRYTQLKDVRYDGFSESSVCACLSGVNHTCQRHYWCYEKDYSAKLEEINRYIIEQYQDGELIKRYSSNSEIVQAGYLVSCVNQCLNNRLNTYLGCTWRYAS